MKRLVTGITLACLGLGLAGCQMPQLRDRIADQERTIRRLRDDKGALEGRLRGTSDQLAEARDALEEERARSRSLEGEVEGLRAEATRTAAAPADTGLDVRRREMEKLLEGTEGSVQVRDGDLVISLPGSITFASGSASLTGSGKRILSRLYEELRRRYRDKTISIEGHTDSDPIRKSKFKTNWRLSVERAMAVRDFLEERGGVHPDRFRVVGYGPYRPVVDGAKGAAKERNRRVEIVIVSS